MSYFCRIKKKHAPIDTFHEPLHGLAVSAWPVLTVATGTIASSLGPNAHGKAVAKANPPNKLHLGITSHRNILCSSMLHLASLIWHDATERLTQVACRSTVGGGRQQSSACGLLVGDSARLGGPHGTHDTTATCKQHPGHMA